MGLVIGTLAVPAGLQDHAALACRIVPTVISRDHPILDCVVSAGELPVSPVLAVDAAQAHFNFWKWKTGIMDARIRSRIRQQRSVRGDHQLARKPLFTLLAVCLSFSPWANSASGESSSPSVDFSDDIHVTEALPGASPGALPDSHSAVLRDTDGDGVDDSVDIDNDNNGVLNIEEQTDTYYLPSLIPASPAGTMNQENWLKQGADETLPIDSSFPHTDAYGLPWYNGKSTASAHTVSRLVGPDSSLGPERSVSDTFIHLPHGNYLRPLNDGNAVVEVRIRVSGQGTQRIAHYWAEDGIPANAERQGETLIDNGLETKVVATILIPVGPDDAGTVRTFWTRTYTVDTGGYGVPVYHYSLDHGATWSLIPDNWFSTSGSGASAFDFDYHLQADGRFESCEGKLMSAPELVASGAWLYKVDLDTDGDGIHDSYDVDNDNDGITDNVEVQATGRYLPPTGTGPDMVDLDRDGLDDIYDMNTASASVSLSIGLLPVDTDMDGSDDYNDADSDNDNVADIAERGDGAPSTLSDLTDSDFDGLPDLFEGRAVDDNYDVNDENHDADSGFRLAGDVLLSADGLNAVQDTRDLYFRDNTPAAPTVIPLTTRIATPTLTGTAATGSGESLTIEVDDTVYTPGDGNLIHDPVDNSWSLTIPADTVLADGNYDVIARVHHVNGKTAEDADAINLTIDTTAPGRPTVVPLITNNTTPTLSGRANLLAGETLSVLVNGVLHTVSDGTLEIDAQGNWRVTFTAAEQLSNGRYEVTATITDAAGNSTSDNSIGELSIDTLAPSLPTVVAQITSDPTPVLSGVAVMRSGERLDVTVNGSVYAMEQGDLDIRDGGHWILSIPPGHKLADGSYDVTATIRDPAGNLTSDSTAGELQVDTAAPAVPTITAMVTNDVSPVLSGAAVLLAGESLSVTVDAVTYLAGDARSIAVEGRVIVDENGRWSLKLPAADALVDGRYDVSVVVTDLAGNQTTDTTGGELLVDTVAPSAPTVTLLAANDSTPVLSGTAGVQRGESLSVSVGSEIYHSDEDDLVVNGGGTWSLTIPAGNGLADGIYDVVASVTDEAGNTARDLTDNELLVDTTMPVVPTVVAQTVGSALPTLQGTATLQAGETLAVVVNGVTYTVGDGGLVVDSSGDWLLTIPAGDELVDGEYGVSVTVTDSAGNRSVDLGDAELVVDTTAPTTPVVSLLTTNDTTPVLVGTATLNAGESLSVSIDGVTYQAGGDELVMDGDRDWILAIPERHGLAEGRHDVTAMVIDSAGNTATDITTGELLVDTTPPARPVVNALETGDATPVLSGRAALLRGDRLSVLVGGFDYRAGDGSLTVDAEGNWALSVPPGRELPEGLHDVTVSITDAAGNTVTDNSGGELVVDLSPPAAPTVNNLVTNDSSPTVTGTSKLGAGESLSITLNGRVYRAGDGLLLLDSSGHWELKLPANQRLGEGTFDVIATVTDAAGNRAVDASQAELTVDITAPPAPAVTGQTTSDTTPLITGMTTRDPGLLLSVMINGVRYDEGDGELVVHSNGTWELQLPDTEALVEGSYDVTVILEDEAGNVSRDRGSRKLVIDTTQPHTPGVTGQTSGSTTPSVSGTASVGPGETLTVEVNGRSYTAGDGNLNYDELKSSWLLVIPAVDALPEGVFDVVASVTDQAGNISFDRGVDMLVIDISAPMAPSVLSLTTNRLTPTLQGRATLGPGETLRVEVDGVVYQSGDDHLIIDAAEGTWSLTIPPENALSEGTYGITVAVIDAGGNTTFDPTGDELVIDTTVPAAPVVNTNINRTSRPEITGTAVLNAEETLIVVVDGVAYREGDGNLTVDHESSDWRLVLPEDAALKDGVYDIEAVIVDKAGNRTVDRDSGELVVDMTPPESPVIHALTTNNRQPMISGFARLEVDELLQVRVGDTVFTAGDGHLTVYDDGNWELTVPAMNALPQGRFDLVATVEDRAGNISGDVSVDELVVDTEAPSMPTVDTLFTSLARPSISGRADVAADHTMSVALNGRTYTSGDGGLVNLDPDGNWSVELPADHELPLGTSNLTVSLTDVAGNVSTVSSSILVAASATEMTICRSAGAKPLRPVFGGQVSVTDGTRVNLVDGTQSQICETTVRNTRWLCEARIDVSADMEDLSATLTDRNGQVSVAMISRMAEHDTDGDGLPDLLESDGDFDGDGVTDNIDLDSDNDGIVDRDEGLLDTDADGIPNYQDRDSDNDGLPDTREAGGSDIDMDFQIDRFVDANHNGLHDGVEAHPLELPDTDNDAIEDYRDLDSDQDGITDLREAYGLDTDNDGMVDFVLDKDGDGIDDRHSRVTLSVPDTDNDGLEDYRDLDSDANEIFDIVEAGGTDKNGDGQVDVLADVDRDSIPDDVDIDQKKGADTNGNGIDDRFDARILKYTDYDGDDIADIFDRDYDGNGYIDEGLTLLTASSALGIYQEDMITGASASKGGGGCTLRSGGVSEKRDLLLPLLVFLVLTGLSGSRYRRRACFADQL